MSDSLRSLIPPGFSGGPISGLVAAQIAQNAAATAGGGANAKGANPLASGVPFLRGSISNAQGLSAAGVKGGTSRQRVVAPYNGRSIQVIDINSSMPGNGEGFSPNPFFAAYVLEDVNNTQNTFFDIRFATSRDYQTVYPGAAIVSQKLNYNVAQGAAYFFRKDIRLALPPTSLAATASATGGSVGSGTQNVVFTAVVQDGVESGPIAAASVTTTGTTSSIAVAIGAPDPLGMPALSYNCYLNGFLYDNGIKPNTRNYVIDGSLAVTTQAAPTASHQFPVGLSVQTSGGDNPGQGFNYNGAGNGNGNASRQLKTTGTAWITGNYNNTVCSIALIQFTPDLGIDSVPQHAACGDSRTYGQGNVADRGPLVTALLNAGIPHVQLGRPGESASGVANSGGSPLRYTGRWNIARGRQHHWNNYIGNDIKSGVTYAIAQANMIAFSMDALSYGAKYRWAETCSPIVNTTDNTATTANQTPNPTSEPLRQLDLAWKRDGAPVSIAGTLATGLTITPFSPGTTDPTAVRCNVWGAAGQLVQTASGPSTALTALHPFGGVPGQAGGIVDIAAAVSTDAQGAANPYGSYWITGLGTFDGTHPPPGVVALQLPAYPISAMQMV